MRLLQISVPDGSQEDVTGVLSEYDLPYVVHDATGSSDVEAVVSVPMQPEDVEVVLDDLRELSLGDEQLTVVFDVNTVLLGGEEIEFDEPADEDAADRVARISREELRVRAGELLPSRSTYLLMTAVSAIVATAGVLMDSAAVVVGSMVIAPLIGPSLAASAGTVLDDQELSRAGLRLQLVGVALAVGAAMAFAFLVKSAFLVPPDIVIPEISQVRERLEPDFLALAIAFGAGIAGGVSLATGVSAAIVGVMIAVALIPPAAVIGIGIAWGLPTVVLGASVLLVLNLAAINLSALGVFWFMGFRPAAWFRTSEARSRTFRRLALLGTVVVALSLFLGVVTFASYQASVQEDEVTTAVEEVLEQVDGEVSLLELTVERNDRPLFTRPERVIITVSRPAGEPAPPLADAIATEVRVRIDREVTVDIRHVEREQAT